jgi:hypothetical protein
VKRRAERTALFNAELWFVFQAIQCATAELHFELGPSIKGERFGFPDPKGFEMEIFETTSERRKG